MLARFLYAAVAISVLGAFPRGRSAPPVEAARPAEARSAAEVRAPAIGPTVRARKDPRSRDQRICQAGGIHGIDRNPSDFAIPRIDR